MPRGGICRCHEGISAQRGFGARGERDKEINGNGARLTQKPRFCHLPIFQGVPRARRRGRAQARGRRGQVRQRAVGEVPVVLVLVARRRHLIPVPTHHDDGAIGTRPQAILLILACPLFSGPSKLQLALVDWRVVSTVLVLGLVFVDFWSVRSGEARDHVRWWREIEAAVGLGRRRAEPEGYSEPRFERGDHMVILGGPVCCGLPFFQNEGTKRRRLGRCRQVGIERESRILNISNILAYTDA